MARTRTLMAVMLVFVLIVAAGLGMAAMARAHAARVVRLPAGEVVEGDWFAAGETVEVFGTVKGDVYAFGRQVRVDGVIDGDLLAAGGMVAVGGTVTQDVRAAGAEVMLTGSVGRNLTMAGGYVEASRPARVAGNAAAAGGEVVLAGRIEGDAKAAGGSVTLSGPIGGGVDAATGELRITSTARVGGDISYLSDTDAAVDAGADLGGSLVRTPPTDMYNRPEDFAGRTVKRTGYYAAGASFASTLVLGLLLIRFFPVFSARASGAIGTSPLTALGLGVLALVAMPVISLVLIVTIAGIPLGLMLLSLFFVVAYISRVFFIFWAGRKITRGRSRRGYLAFLSGLALYAAISLIPIAGGLVALAAVVLGTGSAVMTQKQTYGEARSREMI